MKNLEELQKHINRIVHKQNNTGLPHFEGYSPNEMRSILYDTFGDNSPIQLVKLQEADYRKIPILNQIKYLLQIIEDKGELKLTARGFLPTKIVADIYNQNFIRDKMIDSGISKLYKETDSMSISLTRILPMLSGIVKKRNNKLSLTKKGQKEIKNNHRLLKSIFTTFGSRFNWAYFDGFGDNNIGQLGFGFSLILISKYGSKKRIDSFYSKKYFSAFPRLIDRIEPSRFSPPESRAINCYSLRTFERFLDYFGLIEIYSEGKWEEKKFITKTELFDKLIKIRPHTYTHRIFGR